MRKVLLLIAFLCLPALAAAQTGIVQNHCYLGGKKAITSGTSSTNYADGIIPACTVTVYLSGTTTKATITTPSGGVLSNPFTANAATAVDPGGWIFRAATNAGLDVVMSGGGGNPACTTQPNCYATPVTLTDVFPSQSFTPVSGVTSIIPGTNITCATDVGGSCTGAVTVNGSASGIASINSQTGPAITVHSSDSSITVTTTTNDIDLTTTGGGIPYNPGTTQFYAIASSRWKASDGAVATATAVSCDGTNCTVTATNTFTSNQWIRFGQEGNGVGTWTSPTCLANSVVQVLSTGLSGSQFEVAEVDPDAVTPCSGVITGAGGAVQNASGYISVQLGNEPFISGHGTVHRTNFFLETTLASLNTNYSTAIHPYMPAVTGVTPTYVISMTGFNDSRNTGGSCPVLATMKTATQTLWTSLHTDGALILAVPEAPNTSGSIQCSTGNVILQQYNDWLAGQGPGSTTTTAHWDYIAKPIMGSDLNPAIWDTNDTLVFAGGGAKIVSGAINSAISSQGSFPLGTTLGNGPNLINGYQEVVAAGSNTCALGIGYGLTNYDAYQLCANSKGGFTAAGNALDRVIQYNSGTTTMVDALSSNGVAGWLNGTDQFFSSVDTGLSRDSAGVLDLGNGTKGDKSGSLNLTNLTVTGTCTGCSPAPAFSAITGSTNTTAAMLVGSGASLTPTGTGAIQATNIASTVAVSSPITITGSGTTASPYTIACPTCGTGTGGTSVSQNSGAAETNLPITGFMPQLCADTSGSGTAQSCTVANTFTPQTGNCIVYSTTTANSGTGLTVNVNSLGAKSVAVAGSSGWTTTLVASSSIPANKPLHMCYDGTNWNASGTGFAASGGSGSQTNITGTVTISGCTVTSNPTVCTVGVGGSASIVISSIPSGYNDLMIRVVGQTSNAAAQNLNIQFNSDTGANYSSSFMGAGTGSTATSGHTDGATSIACAVLPPSSSAAYPNTASMTIYNYTSTTWNKNLDCVNVRGQTASTNSNIFHLSGLWKNATPAAITTMTMALGAGNFVQGSTITIYGLN